MKKLLTALPVVAIFLFSCQKEVSIDSSTNPGNGGGSNGTRLMKMVYKDGSDSSVVNFSYNASGQLIGMITTGNDGGTPIDIRETFLRNSQGILQKQIIKDAELIQNGVDSILMDIRYDAALARYSGWIMKVDIRGVILKDSAVLVYDNGGNVTSTLAWSSNGSGSYRPATKFEYTYSGKNIITRKAFTYQAGVYKEDFTITNEYDTKTAPLILGNESFVIEPNTIAPFFSSNNATKETVTYPTEPAETTTITYTYNSFNRPATAVANLQPGGIYNVTYYYQ